MLLSINEHDITVEKITEHFNFHFEDDSKPVSDNPYYGNNVVVHTNYGCFGIIMNPTNNCQMISIADMYIILRALDALTIANLHKKQYGQTLLRAIDLFVRKNTQIKYLKRLWLFDIERNLKSELTTFFDTTLCENYISSNRSEMTLGLIKYDLKD